MSISMALRCLLRPIPNPSLLSRVGRAAPAPQMATITLPPQGISNMTEEEVIRWAKKIIEESPQRMKANDQWWAAMDLRMNEYINAILSQIKLENTIRAAFGGVSLLQLGGGVYLLCKYDC